MPQYALFERRTQLFYMILPLADAIEDGTTQHGTLEYPGASYIHEYNNYIIT